MPRALYGLDPYIPEYDVAADGRVITVRRDALPEIHMVLNWAEELRRALGHGHAQGRDTLCVWRIHPGDRIGRGRRRIV